MKHLLVFTALLVVAPTIVLADSSYIFQVFFRINMFISLVFPIIIALALLVFLWGIAKFILQSGDEKAVENGKQLMIWGLVCLFCVVSVWGIVKIAQGMFDVEDVSSPTTPVVEYNP